MDNPTIKQLFFGQPNIDRLKENALLQTQKMRNIAYFDYLERELTSMYQGTIVKAIKDYQIKTCKQAERDFLSYMLKRLDELMLVIIYDFSQCHNALTSKLIALQEKVSTMLRLITHWHKLDDIGDENILKIIDIQFICLVTAYTDKAKSRKKNDAQVTFGKLKQSLALLEYQLCQQRALMTEQLHMVQNFYIEQQSKLITALKARDMIDNLINIAREFKTHTMEHLEAYVQCVFAPINGLEKQIKIIEQQLDNKVNTLKKQSLASQLDLNTFKQVLNHLSQNPLIIYGRINGQK